jgi:V/A-type H+-transporting ATPase subunit D
MAVYKLTPTKANLLKLKDSLRFAEKGFELMDRKRMVLIREMMSLLHRAEELQNEIASDFEEAYEALKLANITMGSDIVVNMAESMSGEKEFSLLFQSIMGVEVPMVKRQRGTAAAEYGFYRTNPAFDLAVLKFNAVRELIYELAEMENSIYKLALEIKKTQKRANALGKIHIPKHKATIKYIDEVLEEKEREDFYRLKRIKEKRR